MDNSHGQPVSEIKITRSPKRKKTVSAHLNDGVLAVCAPSSISDKELNKIIVRLTERLLKKKLKRELDRKQDLKDIAEKLNRKYFGGRLQIAAIDYSTYQNSRFGCCNLRTGKILISHRLAAMPDWVRDYVIVHELAHLIVPNHSKPFHDLITKYRWKERAIGYLIAKGYEEDEMDINEV